LALSRGLKLPLIRLLIVIGLVHLFLRYARNAELLAMLTPLVVAPVLARQWPSLRPGLGTPGGNLLVQRMHALARPAGHAALVLSLAVAALYAGAIIRLGGLAPPPSTMPQA